MPYLSKIVQKTLENLKSNDVVATPYEYEKEFNKIAKVINYSNKDTIKLNNLVSAFFKNDTKSAKSINSFEDIIPYILKNNKDAIIKTNNDVKHKTNQLTSMMNSYSDNVTKSLIFNKNGQTVIKKINEELKQVDTNSSDNLAVVHSKIENIAKSIETQIEKTNKNLKNNEDEISLLRKQVEQLEEKLHTTKEENKIDYLTGAYTRKAYDNYVKSVEEKYRRTGEDYALIFFDLDHFKNVNDVYGHDAGDVVLSTFSKILLKATRDSDVIARYGGEEFIGLVYFKEQAELEDYVKRIKNIVTSNKFIYKDEKISITFSSGVTIRSKNKSYDNTILLADELLYKAKETGRNKSIFQDGTEV